MFAVKIFLKDEMTSFSFVLKKLTFTVNNKIF